MKRAALVMTVLLLVGVGCSSKKPTAKSPNASAPPAATTSAKASAKASASTSRGASGSGGSTTSVAPSPLPTGGSSSTAPVVPPTAGVYHYTQSGSTVVGQITFDADPEGTLAIGAPTASGTGKLQKQSRQYSSNWSADQYLLFKSDAIYLQQTTQRYSFGFVSETTCKPDHPLKAVPLPLKVGKTWSDSGTCNGLTVSLTGKVLRTETRTVGGKSLSTYLLDVKTHTTGSGYNITTDLMTWISPTYRLAVHSVSTSSGSTPQGNLSQNFTETLKSLTPDA